MLLYVQELFCTMVGINMSTGSGGILHSLRCDVAPCNVIWHSQP